MGRRSFTAEFKREAVRLVVESGLPVSRAAQQLGLHANVLRKWVRDFRADPAQAFPGHGRMKPEQAEIERLKKELVRVKAERDILKKATAYFAKESH
jgi:transposase